MDDLFNNFSLESVLDCYICPFILCVDISEFCLFRAVMVLSLSKLLPGPASFYVIRDQSGVSSDDVVLLTLPD